MKVLKILILTTLAYLSTNAQSRDDTIYIESWGYLPLPVDTTPILRTTLESRYQWPKWTIKEPEGYGITAQKPQNVYQVTISDNHSKYLSAENPVTAIIKALKSLTLNTSDSCTMTIKVKLIGELLE